jgi:hypothetical protein
VYGEDGYVKYKAHMMLRLSDKKQFEDSDEEKNYAWTDEEDGSAWSRDEKSCMELHVDISRFV